MPKPDSNEAMQHAVTDLFDRYEHVFNESLAGTPDLDALNDLYADAFVGAAPAGVMAGKKGDELDKAMAAGFAHYREIGTQGMAVREVRVEPIDALHALAHVAWRATYEVKGDRKVIDFTNVYLVRVEDGRAKVFGWITGDEDAALRKAGVID